MQMKRDILVRLAASRSRRMNDMGRPVFDLTQEELAGSAHAAMQVADASRSRVAEREQLAAPVGAC